MDSFLVSLDILTIIFGGQWRPTFRPHLNFKEGVRWTKDGIEMSSPIAGADDGRTENSLCPLPRLPESS